MEESSPITSKTLLLLVLLGVAYISWSEYRTYLLQKNISNLQTENTSHTEKLSSEVEVLAASSTESSLALNNLYMTLSRIINEESAKNTALEERLGLVSNTVGSLDKLSKTDPQILKKYSKVYFLNENYTPVSLETLPQEYIFNKNNPYQIHTDVAYFLEHMIDDAKKEGFNFLIISGYRSFATQVDVKATNKVRYGVGTANQFSAEQGFSEHQLGTTVDFTTEKTGTNFAKFEATKEYQWLKDNAYKYGFILSYPKGNKYYAYEPWHWRFVGVSLATQLYQDKIYFYDLDQRTIDAYLLKIFDR